MKINKYYIKARLFPTILTSIPILGLYYFAFSDKLIGFITFLEGYKWASDVTISIALIYLLVQVNRFISKELFQNFFFKDELYMPTTNFLLHSDSNLAKSMKLQITKKISKKFKIKLLDSTTEKEDEIEARKTISSAVSQIRNATRGNAMLLQHNIEYGFVRNFIGGSVLAVLISVFSIYLFNHFYENELAYKLYIMLLALYSTPIIVSKVLIKKYGKYYAKVLFEQFLIKK
jgi:hypothetical protein